MFSTLSISIFTFFIIQLLVISYFIPQKMIHRMRYIIKNFPIDEYPKLYVEPIEYYYRRLFYYRLFNMIIFIIGLLFMIMVSYESESGMLNDGVPLIYGLVQFAPYVFLEISEFRKFRIMRKIVNVPQREASLVRRRFFDYVNPKAFYGAVILQVVYIFIELFMPDFQLHLETERLVRLGTIIFVDIYFAVFVSWSLYGKKVDPFQSSEDRTKITRVAIRSSVYVSYAISIFYIFTVLIEQFDIDYISFFLNSTYMQLVAVISVGSLLRNNKIEDIDFNVYKADSPNA